MSARSYKHCHATLGPAKRADALYCNDGCGREYRRQRQKLNGHMPEGRYWVGTYTVEGHWRKKPTRRAVARRSPATAHS